MWWWVIKSLLIVAKCDECMTKRISNAPLNLPPRRNGNVMLLRDYSESFYIFKSGDAHQPWQQSDQLNHSDAQINQQRFQIWAYDVFLRGQNWPHHKIRPNFDFEFSNQIRKCLIWKEINGFNIKIEIDRRIAMLNEAAKMFGERAHTHTHTLVRWLNAKWKIVCEWNHPVLSNSFEIAVDN